MTDILSLIIKRRSVRQFKPQAISSEITNQILEAGRWAPSGGNNQPWRLVAVQCNKIIKKLADLSPNSGFIKEASLHVVVFLDKNVSSERTIAVQSIGACIQNMLLAAHGLGLGGCWIGDILVKREAVEKLLVVPEPYELMAVLAIGYPAIDIAALSGTRKKLSELAIKK